MPEMLLSGSTHPSNTFLWIVTKLTAAINMSLFCRRKCLFYDIDLDIYLCNMQQIPSNSNYIKSLSSTLISKPGGPQMFLVCDTDEYFAENIKLLCNQTFYLIFIGLKFVLQLVYFYLPPSRINVMSVETFETSKKQHSNQFNNTYSISIRYQTSHKSVE